MKKIISGVAIFAAGVIIGAFSHSAYEKYKNSKLLDKLIKEAEADSEAEESKEEK